MLSQSTKKPAKGILELAASGDGAGVLRDMRVRSLYSSYYFVKVVLGYRHLVDHLHQHDMDLFLDRWAAGVRKQFIEWPRGFFKTTSFTIGTSIWVVLPHNDEDTQYALEVLRLDEAKWFERLSLHNQDAMQLLAFETIDNSKKKIAEIQDHFEENDIFRALFSEIAYLGTERPWNSTCLKLRRVADIAKRADEGTFEAIGVGGALQSRHYDIVWEDDLVGERARKSDTVMQDTIGWHGRLSGAFVNAAKQVRFVVSNRWGYADLNSHVRAQEPDFEFYTRSAWELDAETGKEISIFPERYPMKALFAIRDSGSMSKYDFSCQYLNSPQMPGEKEIDADKLHFYEIVEGELRCSCGASFRPSQLLRFMHYDPYNAKQAGSTSLPAIAVTGTSVDHHTILLDYYIGKGSYAEVYRNLFAFNDKWKPCKFTYEDVGHQNLTAFHIRQTELTSDHLSAHRRFPTITAIPTRGKAKEIRIRDGLLAYIQTHGKFAIRKSHVAPAEQLNTFPNKVLGHDYDLLDSLNQGASRDKNNNVVWRFPENYEEERQTRSEEDEYQKLLGVPYSHVEVRVGA